MRQLVNLWNSGLDGKILVGCAALVVWLLPCAFGTLLFALFEQALYVPVSLSQPSTVQPEPNRAAVTIDLNINEGFQSPLEPVRGSNESGLNNEPSVISEAKIPNTPTSTSTSTTVVQTTDSPLPTNTHTPTSTSTSTPSSTPTSSPSPLPTASPTPVPPSKPQGTERYRGPVLLISQTTQDIIVENISSGSVAIRVSWDDQDPWGRGDCPKSPEDCFIDNWVTPGEYVRGKIKAHISVQVWAWGTQDGLVDSANLAIVSQ